MALAGLGTVLMYQGELVQARKHFGTRASPAEGD